MCFGGFLEVSALGTTYLDRGYLSEQAIVVQSLTYTSFGPHEWV